MKTLFDRHAETMTPMERGLAWERVAIPEKPQRVRGVVFRAAPIVASLAVATIVLALLLREVRLVRRPVTVETRGEPAIPSAPAPLSSPGPAPRLARTVPRAGIHAAPPPAVPRSIAALSEIPAPALRSGAPRITTTTGPGVLGGRIVDDRNQPVPYASVRIREMRRGALADEDGRWRVEGLPLATYSVEVRALGRPAEIREGLAVDGKTPTIADVQMKESMVVSQLEQVEVAASKRIDTRSSTTKQTISAEKLRELPVDNLKETIGTKTGVVAQGGELHFRGGRGDEVKFQFDGREVQAGPANGIMLGAPADVSARSTNGVTPPVVPTTGGTRLPNDEPFDSMFFKNYGVNPFVPTDEDPLSTFAVDVDAASFTLARRYLELDQMPPADAVRVEEFVNWLPQGYRRPERDDFAIAIDGAPSPFGTGYQLLRVGLAARAVDPRDRRPAQLTFVIDISGSMAREERLGLVKRALRLLVDQLRRDDQVGIVVYGSTGRVLLEPSPVGDDPVADARDDDEPAAVPASFSAGRRRILAAIEQLQPDGSTNAEEGLRLGYDMARRAYRPRALNRILLCSDGVANVGLTGPESILAQVKTDADRGISLTTIGFGMGNYNDVLMEQLADRGDGNHYYVDEIGEARRVFVENLTGTLQTLGRDAKVQVEFDSTRVLRYRLLGFENRDVADRDFRNDKVDAGEIGAGHTVTALYEVKLARDVRSGTLATVRLRWASPEHAGSGLPKVREIEQRFDARSLARRLDDTDPYFRLDAAAAEFAEILRGSYWAKESRFTDVLPVARHAARELRDESSATVLAMIEKAARLKK